MTARPEDAASRRATPQATTGAIPGAIPAAAPTPARIAEHFALAAPILGVQPYGTGLINRTYLVTTAGPAYVLQRLNDQVFPQPGAILDNLQRLTRHLRGRDGPPLPALVPARTGELGAWDEAGGLWRMLSHIPRSRVLPRVETQTQAAAVGEALGRFHRLCADLDPHELTTTLPGFHVTPAYLAHLNATVMAGTLARQPAEVHSAFERINARQALASVLEMARRDGRLPARVVHGDPKLDNILFDEAGRRVVGLIDLDTVQPGLVHHDIGDCLRSICNCRGELGGAATFDLALCQALLAAYARTSDGLLGEAEVSLLYDALRLIPFELGLRFLTDHLEGDRYFRVQAPGENLTRAQGQLALLGDIEAKESEIRQIIDECFAR